MTSLVGVVVTRSKTSIMTASGRFFDPLNPKAEDVDLGDIARGLRRGVACRFNGQLLDPAECPSPQTGASHCMRSARLTHWKLINEPFNATPADVELIVAKVFAALIHDAPEGYVGDDLGPIKTPERKAMEAVILGAIVESLLGEEYVPFICGLVHTNPTVRWADDLSLRQEALLYQPGSSVWALPVSPGASALQLRVDLADTLHLFHPREGEDWAATTTALASMLLEGFDATNSEQALDRLAELMR